MRIILLNLPVHLPTMMPYSITMMKALFSSSLQDTVKVLDLNAEYHYNEYKEYYNRINREPYFVLLDEFIKETRRRYQIISKSAVSGEKPKGHEYLIKQIENEKPDIVCISLVYNSQVFFAKGIIDDLTKKGIKVVIGGPADKSIIKGKAVVLQSYHELLAYLSNAETKKPVLDFSDYKHYFTKDTIYPLRTSISCAYKQCVFCTHHGNLSYEQLDLSNIKQSIIKNNMKKIFFIDDDFTLPRLEELADLLMPLNVKWWCQLRPLKGVIPLLPKLKKSGLYSAAWGIESGCQRILDFMNKGTKIKEIEQVLKKSNELGIKNMVYILFGFPTETKQEFMQTIEFLHKNKDYIDLVSPTIFGVQKGSKIFENPDKYGIKISSQKRTLLGEKLNYMVENGLTHKEVKVLKKTYLNQIEKIDKVPKIIKTCKEQILNMD
ncbi:MAG: radical SAM protein [Nanoarchaeota archaeon]